MIKRYLIVMLIGLLAACAPTETDSPTVAVTSDEPVAATPTRENDAEAASVSIPTANSDNSLQGDPGSDAGFQVAAAQDGFQFSLFGATTAEDIGAGVLNCENGQMVIRATNGDFPQITLILPQGSGTGEFTLHDHSLTGDSASASVFLADGSVFAADVEGILIVDALADAIAEEVRGSFDFSASSGTSLINARGEFDFVADAQDSFCEQ